MTAIEYGKKYFGNYSLNNQINNIKVFCDTMQVDDSESQNSINNNPNNAYIECEYIQNVTEPYFKKKENGLHLSTYVIDYIIDSGCTSIEIISPIRFEKPIIGGYITAEVRLIEGRYYIYYNKDAAGITELPELNIKAIKLNRPLFNISELLKDKQISVVVFISKDGALLESAYQKIDKVFKNEVIILVERNDDTNIFNSVIRVKTGENVTLNSNFPSKQVSQIATIFKLDIDEKSIQEIIQKHFTEKDSVIYAIKRRFFGGSRVVVLALNIILDPFIKVSDGLSGYLDTLKLDDSRWQYYDEKGSPVEKPKLLLPGLELLQKLEQTTKESLINESNYKLLIKKAVAILDQLKEKLKETDFEIHPKIKKMMRIIRAAISQFIIFLTNPTDDFVALGKQHFILANAFLVGIINGLIEAVRGIFELLSLGIQLLQKSFGAINTTIELTGSVLVMFTEMIENAYEFCVNLFTEKNFEALLQFFKDAFVFIVSLPSKVYNWITTDNNTVITLDRVGYYIGYIIGTVIEIVLEILATGGVATVAEAIQKLSQELISATKSIGKAVQKGARATVKGLQISFEFLLSIFNYISEKSKNLKTFFEDFWKWINDLFDIIKAKIILSSGVVLYCEIIPIGTFANGLKKILKAKWLKELEGLGLVIGKQSDNVYSFVYKGVEIFKGTKAEAETALKEYFENSKKGGLEKYLDDLSKSIRNFDEIYKTKYVRPTGLFEKLSFSQVVKKFGKRGGELFNVVEKEWELTRLRLTSGNARMKEVLVSGMIDKETGKISKVFSNFTRDEIFLGKHLDFIKELHPTLKKRLSEHIKRVGKNGSGLNLDDPEVYKFAWQAMDNAHAEFRALDDILWKIDPKGELGESAINRILGYNSFLKKEGIQHTCADCFYLTYGVTYIK